MKVWVIIALFSMLLFASGETVYKKKCASCHLGYISMGKLKENFVEYNNTKLHLKAPTLNQLSFRLKQKIGDPSGDKEFHMMEVTSFIQDYLYAPDKSKSVCMKEVLAIFDTMPSMKGKITSEEIEAVAQYLYEYDTKMMDKHSVHYQKFDQALIDAKKEGKIVMVKATSEFCHYCKQMDREVLADEDVLKVLKKDFIAVSVDVYKEDLPMDLKFTVTPTYFFIDSHKKVLLRIPGALTKKDFLHILEEVKK